MRTVRRWIAEKTLQSVKVRGVRLVPWKDLERMLSPAPLSCAESTEDIEQNGGIIT